MSVKRLLSSLLAIVVLLVSFAGCSNNAGSNPSTAPETQDTADEPTVNVDTSKAAEKNEWEPAKDPSEYKIVCYWPAPDVFFDNYVLEGIKAFEKDYGVDVEWVIGTEWTQDVENQMVEAKAAEGYDLFYIFGADTSGANALYKELYDNGCKVINYAGLVDDPQESALTLASDVYLQAYYSTKQLIEYMDGEGTIINVLEQLGDVNTQKRQQGVEDAVKEYPNVSIAQTVADITSVDQGYEKVYDALTANPDAKGIIATGGTASRGLANALQDYYGTNPDAEHIFAATMDQADEVINGIKDGSIDHTVAQNGWAMGYVSALLLMYMDDGWEPINWGEHIDTGYVFITEENVDSWQTDIESKAMELIESIETDILKKP